MDAAPSNAHLESNVESTFRLEVRKLGGAAIKLVPTIKGLPDRLVIMPGGRVYFVELKTKDGSPSAAQRLWRDRLKKLGCDVTILYGAQEVKTWIAEITEAAGPQFRKSRYDD